MATEDAPVVESTRKLSRAVLWLFAAVGFLAAVTQIASYFTSTTGALRVRVTPHEAAVPQTILTAIKEGDSPGFLTQLISDEKRFFCEAAPNSSASVADKKEFQTRCSQYDAAESLEKLLRGYDGSETFLDYSIENTGSAVAREIRLSGSLIYSVDLRRTDSDAQDLRKSAGEDFYRLPDLNPGEKLQVRVWSSDSTLAPDYPYLSMDSLPRVTFDGGKANMTLYKLAPSWYFDINDFLSTFPVAISVVFILIACTVIGLLVILLLSIVVTLAKGEPISKVFESPQTEKRTRRK